MRIKRILSVVLSICLIISITTGLDIIANAEERSGMCGNNVKWTLDTEAKTLVLSGEGETKAPSIGYMLDESFWLINAKDIKTIIIEEGITTIDDSLFSGCNYAESVVIPKSVYSIGKKAFNNCSKLTDVTMPCSATVQEGGDASFAECQNIERVTITLGTTNEMSESFAACPWGKGVKEVVIEDGIINLGSKLFSGCSELTSVTIPDSVTVINNSVFSNCVKLKSISIPSGVTKIGTSAFNNCISLEKMVLPDSLKNLGSGAFTNCSSIKSFSISDKNTSFATPDGNLYNKKLTKLIHYASGSDSTSFDIPDTVDTIGQYAFAGCQSLECIDIPDTVFTIDNCAFMNCTGLKNVTIPETIDVINEGVFSYCTSLKEIVIPESVFEIIYNAFSGCTALETVYYPTSIIMCDFFAFADCNNIETVYYGGTMDEWEAGLDFIYDGNEYLTTANIVCIDGTIEATREPETTTTTTTTTTEIVPVTESTTAKPSNPVDWYTKSTTTTTTQPTVKTTVKAKAKTKVKATSLKKLKGGSKRFTASWKKVSGVTGYQIQYSTGVRFVKALTLTKNVKGAKKTSTTVKGLRAGKTYYVRIRTYKTVKGNKVYSDWSKIKLVRIK